MKSWRKMHKAKPEPEQEPELEPEPEREAGLDPEPVRLIYRNGF